MKKFLLLAGVIMFSGLQAQAAVSPFYDSVRKIESVVNSPDLAEAVEQARIDSITINGNSAVVLANKCGYIVDLEAIEPKAIGAATYSVKVVRGPFCSESDLKGEK